MLKGIRIRNLKKNIDNRGFFSEIIREDWEEFTCGDKIVQTSLSMSYPGVVRAWHRHLRGQIDYIVALKGIVKVCVYDENTGQLNEFILKEDKLQILRVDGKFWHGTENIGSGPSWTLYLTTKLYDYRNPDEDRLPSDSDKIIDPKTGRPYEW